LESDDIPENRGLGLLNVQQRIRLIFGNGYGIKISSGSGGTSVTVTLPRISCDGFDEA
jgi:sensor histidine kinase YesM